MTFSNTRMRTLVTSGVLTLLVTICGVGIDVLDGVCRDTISSETEEAKELSECDDADQLYAIVDSGLTFHHGHCFGESLNTVHDRALLNHSRRWCSRGPPTV